MGAAPFDDPGEGMHAEIARELGNGGDRVTLHLNGVRYFDKPPLLYWLAAGAMTMFGPTEWAARLAPLVGSLAAVAATAFLGARLLGPRAGVIAGLALLTCPGFFAYARYLRPETLFLASIQWGFALLLGTRATAMGGVALGMASLAKDVVGTIGPLGAMLVGQLSTCRRPRGAAPATGEEIGVGFEQDVGEDRQRRSRTAQWAGIALLVVVASTWYGIVAWRNPGFLWYTVVDNHLLNFAHARHFPDEDVPLGTVEFLVVATLGAFPWILPAALSVVTLVRERAWRRTGGVPWIVLATWVIGVFSVFALSAFKLPHYALPAYPALAVLAARWWQRHPRSVSMLAFHVATSSVIALAAGWIAFGNVPATLAPVFGVTDVYTRKELAAGQAGAMIPWLGLRPLLIATAAVFGLGAAGAAIALLRPVRRLGVVVVLVTMLGVAVLVGRAVAVVSDSRSVRPLAAEVAGRMGPDDVLVHEGPIENSGALEFYSGRRPVILDGRVSVLGFGSTYPDAREAFWDRARFIDAWRGPRHIFLVTVREPARSVISELDPSERILLLASNGRWLYTNRP
jgi:4-amino-4-deoxy-L-arabinose transferase-like glycosyltransferase